MRVGVLARADNRGLGIQTWEWFRHVPDCSALVIREPGAEGQGFDPHLDRYPDALVVTIDRGTAQPGAEDIIRAWLDEVDVFYSPETLYDWRIAEWAWEHDARPVVHINPEFWHPGLHEYDHAVSWWLPTTWHQERLPANAPVVPVPIPTDRWPELPPISDAPTRWVHVVGRRAMADRNGTRAVYQAVRGLRKRQEVHLVTQDRRLPVIRSQGNVKVSRKLGGVENYWDLYEGHDMLLLPRRYGGLCLPANEAIGAGLGVVLSCCPPNDDAWPCAALANGVWGGTIPLGEQQLQLFDPHPHLLTRLMDELADPDARRPYQERARELRERLSWAKMLPAIMWHLEREADRL